MSVHRFVKAPEKAAFEKYLPAGVHILSCHFLHGPTVSTIGQPLVRATTHRNVRLHSLPPQVLIQYRVTDETLTIVKHIFAPLHSRSRGRARPVQPREEAGGEHVPHLARRRTRPSRCS